MKKAVLTDKVISQHMKVTVVYYSMKDIQIIWKKTNGRMLNKKRESRKQ